MLEMLASAYSFTRPEYVEANRQGRVAEAQKRFFGGKPAGLRDYLREGGGLNTWKLMAWGWLFASFGLIGSSVPTLYAVILIVIGFGILAVLLFRKWNKAKVQHGVMQDELAQGSIRSGIGEVVFRGNQYRVQLEDRVLSLPPSGRLDLDPGVRYRFYYLPQSGVLLSAEAVSFSPEQEAVSGLTEVLAEANSLDLDSLSANRRGQLTRTQSGDLVLPVILFSLLALLPPGGVIYSLFQRGLFEGYPENGSGLGEILGGVGSTFWVIGAAVVALSVFAAYQAVNLVSDIRSGNVVSREGVGFRQISRRSSDDDTRLSYFYQVGGERFQVKEEGYQAFEDGKRYRVYYTPRQKKMVNIEVID